jgi:hypothetical protein
MSMHSQSFTILSIYIPRLLKSFNSVAHFLFCFRKDIFHPRYYVLISFYAVF